MTAVPRLLDGARVLETASLRGSTPTGRTRHVVNGAEITDFATLAIAAYDRNPGVYLFYCDDTWRVVTDTLHDSVEAARAQAELEFGPLTFSPAT